MHKSQAIELLGGSVTSAAAAIGITPQALTQWPDQLPSRLADRVQAALWRMSQETAQGTPPVEPTQQGA